MSGVFGSDKMDVDADKCFVMMPFLEGFNAIYRLIQRCCKEQGLRCERADEDVIPGKITGKIYQYISGSGIIIADMTGKNPNVFYELGLAHAISENVILLTQSIDDVPFDLRDFIHIQYSNTFDGAEKLANELSKVLTTILRSAEVKVALRRSDRKPLDEVPSGDLGDDIIVDLGLFHLQAEISRNNGQMAKAREWLAKALQSALNGEGDAPEIGNCAIEAERCGFYDIAESLYVIALERDAFHLNNRQCYVSFVLDHRQKSQEKIAVAGKILDELEKIPERAERTRALRAQYLTIKQEIDGVRVDLDEMIKDVVGDGEFSTIQQAAPILLLLQKARQFHKFRELIEKLKQKLESDQHWMLDRALADCFANSDDSTLRQEAIHIYRELIQKGFDTSADVKHNLASLLYDREKNVDNEEAHSLWRQAYSEVPGNASIKKAFARYLVRHGMQEEAAKVLEGRPV